MLDQGLELILKYKEAVRDLLLRGPEKPRLLPQTPPPYQNC